jgi:hypothetical protein
MIAEIALEMFRSNLSSPPNFFHLFLELWARVPPSPPPGLGRSPFLDSYFKGRIRLLRQIEVAMNDSV